MSRPAAIRATVFSMALALSAGPALAADPAPAHAPGHAGMTMAPSAAPAAKPDRTITITMDDRMRFHPAQIAVRAGETVALRVENTGRLPHELTIGPIAELLAHAKRMRENPDMPAHHEANAITVAPKHTGTLVWTFGQPGTLSFACLIPGHYEAGMKGEFVISGAHHG